MSKREGPNNNPTIQGKLRSREKLARLQRYADMKEVCSIAGGRRFLYRMIFEDGGLMNLYPGLDAGIYKHEGMRATGFRLAMEMQEEHTDEYILMITEHLRDQENEKKIHDAAMTESNGEENVSE